MTSPVSNELFNEKKTAKKGETVCCCCRSYWERNNSTRHENMQSCGWGRTNKMKERQKKKKQDRHRRCSSNVNPYTTSFDYWVAWWEHTVAIWKVLPDWIAQLIKHNKRGERLNSCYGSGVRVEWGGGTFLCPAPNCCSSIISILRLCSQKKKGKRLYETCRQIPISRHIYKVW